MSSSEVGKEERLVHSAVVSPAPLPGSLLLPSCSAVVTTGRAHEASLAWEGSQGSPGVPLSMTALCGCPPALQGRHWRACLCVLTCSAGFPPRNKDRLKWEENKSGL